jgi:hypothetical protein
MKNWVGVLGCVIVAAGCGSEGSTDSPGPSTGGQTELSVGGVNSTGGMDHSPGGADQTGGAGGASTGGARAGGAAGTTGGRATGGVAATGGRTGEPSGGRAAASGGFGGGGGSGGSGGSEAAELGPLTGSTYCELLASCCAQIVDRGHANRCNRTLEDGNDVGCQVDLNEDIPSLRCGPPVSGLITVEYEVEGFPPVAYECETPGHRMDAMRLALTGSTAQIFCNRIGDDGLLYDHVQFDFSVRGGSNPLSGLGISLGPGAESDGRFSYFRTDEEPGSALLVNRYDPETRELAGDYQGTFTKGVIEGRTDGMSPAPALYIHVEFDVTVPKVPFLLGS